MTELDLSRITWRTSTRSSGNGQCVEIAALGSQIAVRDSKNPHGPVLTVAPAGWQDFIADVKTGAHNLT
jgi:hypothetical protein